MSNTNAAVVQRACELAETSAGLQRMAALCVSAAAATTSMFRGARKALEVIPHSGLRDAAQMPLADSGRGAEVTAAKSLACSGPRAAGDRARDRF